MLRDTIERRTSRNEESFHQQGDMPLRNVQLCNIEQCEYQAAFKNLDCSSDNDNDTYIQ